jgi:hypothetical protein
VGVAAAGREVIEDDPDGQVGEAAGCAQRDGHVQPVDYYVGERAVVAAAGRRPALHDVGTETGDKLVRRPARVPAAHFVGEPGEVELAARRSRCVA